MTPSSARRLETQPGNPQAALPPQRRTGEKAVASAPASRSRTRGSRTATGPMPVMIWRSGRRPVPNDAPAAVVGLQIGGRGQKLGHFPPERSERWPSTEDAAASASHQGVVSTLIAREGKRYPLRSKAAA